MQYEGWKGSSNNVVTLVPSSDVNYPSPPTLDENVIQRCIHSFMYSNNYLRIMNSCYFGLKMSNY